MKQKKAFSLIELMVSITIVFVLTSFFVPNFFRDSSSRVIAERDKLFMTFSYLQQRAMASGREQKIFFNVQGGQYHYFTSPEKKCISNLHKKVCFGFLDHALGPPGKAAKKISRVITFPTRSKIPYATFLPNGTMSNGTVYLVDDQKKYMRALTSPVAPVSCLRKYRYHKGKWMCD